MKSFSIIKKNFKLLIRSKASAFIILIGPLLVILLVGMVFSGKSSYELSIGYYAPEKNNLTVAFVDALSQSKYYVHAYSSEESCVEKIEQGVIHTCIIFSKDFQLTNKQGQELRFLVDYSRMNLVYKVIDSVSGLLETESKELSYSLTQLLLSKINLTLKEIGQDIASVDAMNPQLNLIVADLQKAKANTDSMKLEMRNISAEELKLKTSEINTTFANIRTQGLELINKSQELIEWLSDYISENETADLKEEFDALTQEIIEVYNATPEQITELEESTNKISIHLLEIESDMNQNKELNKDTQEKIDSAKNAIAASQTNLLNLKNALSRTKQNLESISITNAETIVSPVNVKIEPIAAESSQMTFAFPFLLVLVIMFVALLLSSTLVMFEKNSKAFFRVLVTPTKPSLFVVTSFITSFIIIILQTAIILWLAAYFLQIPLFKNPLPILLIIFAISTFFIMLGMLLGYLFSTQEGAVMASIVLGSVFLFLSNLVVPMESIAPALSSIIRFNPYVLGSELLRKALLFKVELQGESLIVILSLLGASLVLFLLMIIFVSLKNRKRAKIKPEPVLKKKTDDIMARQKESGFVLDHKKATNKTELLGLVSDMTKTEFEESINERENKVADWVEKELGDKRLAARLRKTVSRKEIIRLLEEDIKKTSGENDSENNKQNNE
ncbi:MAG TPA: ABC transporter permease [Candidatus Nanoarchaeia archaeon]|nr:ABC transporter permease [Candidatus Nanoarchaeia archaeon]